MIGQAAAPSAQKQLQVAVEGWTVPGPFGRPQFETNRRWPKVIIIGGLLDGGLAFIRIVRVCD